MDIEKFTSRRVAQAALVKQTEAELATAKAKKWPLAERELTVRLKRQKAALAATEAIIAEVSGKA